MKRIAVISADNSPDYFFYLPIVTHYWLYYGWDVAIFVPDDFQGIDLPSEMFSERVRAYKIPLIEGVRPGTCAQTVRHFAANVLPKDAYIMVQDIDLIPLKPWEPPHDKITIYGWPELTAGRFIPVHYTGMPSEKWIEVMGLTGDLAGDMEREMKLNGRAYKEKWEDYWDTDWDILTKRVTDWGTLNKGVINYVHRGMYQCGRHLLPFGRVDRSTIKVAEDGSYSWGESEFIPDYIDMHCENSNPASPEKWKMIKRSLIKNFGLIPEWFDEYVSGHFSKYGR